jgi:NTP pyrophosphatase (non-canonical NTP hydrolase)
MTIILPVVVFLLIAMVAVNIRLHMRNRELRHKLVASKSLLTGCLEKVASRELVADGLMVAIRDANPDREFNTLARRMIKLMEEMGEASEAYLNMTNGTNSKKKTWDDLREELVDVVIVAVDMLLTPFPGQQEMTNAELEDEIMEILGRKLRKWLAYMPALVVGDDA